MTRPRLRVDRGQPLWFLKVAVLTGIALMPVSVRYFTRAQAFFQPDPTPLEKPRPLISLELDPANAHEKVVKALGSQEFSHDTEDSRTGSIEARGPDPRTPGAFDRVIIWLERDYQEPSKRANMNLSGLTGDGNPTRVMLDGRLKDRFENFK